MVIPSVQRSSFFAFFAFFSPTFGLVQLQEVHRRNAVHRLILERNIHHPISCVIPQAGEPSRQARSRLLHHNARDDILKRLLHLRKALETNLGDVLHPAVDLFGMPLFLGKLLLHHVANVLRDLVGVDGELLVLVFIKISHFFGILCVSVL